MDGSWHGPGAIALALSAAFAACYGSSTPSLDVPAESSDTLTDSSDGSADDSQADGGSCVGTPVPCSFYNTSYPCQSQSGCHWSYHDLICAGSAEPCEGASRPGSCVLQAGCTWESCDPVTGCLDASADGSETDGASCVGTPFACSWFDWPYGCDSQSGCEWSLEGCTGWAVPCELFRHSSDTCVLQAGCRWE